AAEPEVRTGPRISCATDESQKLAAVIGALLLGHQSSHQRADQLTAPLGVDESRLVISVVNGPRPCRRTPVAAGSGQVATYLGVRAGGCRRSSNQTSAAPSRIPHRLASASTIRSPSPPGVSRSRSRSAVV